MFHANTKVKIFIYNPRSKIYGYQCNDQEKKIQIFNIENNKDKILLRMTDIEHIQSHLHYMSSQRMQSIFQYKTCVKLHEMTKTLINNFTN